MNHPPRYRARTWSHPGAAVVRLALLLALLLVLATAHVATSAGQDVAVAATSTTVTTKPSVTTGYVANSLRGEYRWLDQAPPDARPAADVYYRDQVPWNQIENTPGTYDDSWLDEGFAQARARHGRFGFRVMAWCPQCWSNSYKPWTVNDWVPSWLPTQPGTTIPDWNSETFLAAWERLWRHLGAKYADDPALGTIDVGGYGAYGEWHRANHVSDTITVANAKRLTAAVLDSFPDTHVVVNAMDPTLTDAVLAMSPRLGLRADCLGAPNMHSILATAAPGSRIAQRWRTAPVLSEWCHAGANVAEGAKQVSTYHVSTVSSGNVYPAYADMTTAQQTSFRLASWRAGYRYAVTAVTLPRSSRRGTSVPVKITVTNSGSAPTYDTWAAELQVTGGDGTVLSRTPVNLNLRSTLPGSRTTSLTLRAPSSGSGGFALRLVVRDPSGYLAPMALANTGRGDDGSYRIGTLNVAR